MDPTKVFDKNANAFVSGKRKIINAGGTSSSKTFSVLELLLIIANKKKDTGILISVVSESLPHLKMGAIRDFETILKANNCYNEKNINKTDHTYSFDKSTIEFFSADSGKATGPRRNLLFLNECNNIPYSVVENLELRTDGTIFYDFNPVSEFWLEEKVLSLPAEDWILIKSNYLDNHHLSKSIIREIELKAANDPNFKRIHIDVEYGNYEGLIFTMPKIIDEFPQHCKWIAYGMDFGFTNDPTTLVKVGISDGEFYFDELIFTKGLSNKNISDLIKENKINSEIIADCADPKSISELNEYGHDVIGCTKGKDSIINGIELIKQYKLNVTKSSVNLIKEFRNYSWKLDKNTGKYTNEPIDLYNHGIDAVRYSISNRLTPERNYNIRMTDGF